MRKKTTEFVQTTAAKAGWVELLIPLIPIIAEVLQNVLQQCANNSAEAVKMITDPTPAQARVMHRRILLAFHRDRSIPLLKRNALAWQAVWDGVEQANEAPDAVAAAFEEAKSAS